MANQKRGKTKGFKAIPIEWKIPDDIVSRFANNILVQQGENEFILSFFEVLPPVLLGSPEEVEAKLEEVEAVQAECVARIIVPAEKMLDFVRAMSENLDRFHSRSTTDEVEK